MLSYFLQVNLCWLLFYGLYYTLLSRETFFTLNRIYLIMSLLAGLCLPLTAHWLRSEIPIIALVESPESILLPEFVLSVQNQVKTVFDTEGVKSLSWWQLLVTLYAVGVVVMSARLVAGLVKLLRLYKTAQPEKIDGYIIADTEGVLQPFSFFNIIFINIKRYQPIDFQNIMQHEMTHARQRHSLDVLFLASLTIVFWFSPFLFL
ncbi:MAG: hypothetical protein HC817_12645 [Saprospiraceae bacterium]|nr:hypothetical protein [Saprospiraceae bacterium]